MDACNDPGQPMASNPGSIVFMALFIGTGLFLVVGDLKAPTA
ncbi:hypothetical protein [Lichenicoccus roseus]|nr:hypothetical protein [Lichenicoccus roseus]